MRDINMSEARHGREPSRAAAGAGTAEALGFVRVDGNRFVDNECKPFYQTGWNGWRVSAEAQRDGPGRRLAQRSSTLKGPRSGPGTRCRRARTASDRP